MIDRVVIPVAGDYTPAAIVAAHSLAEQHAFTNPGEGELLFFCTRGLCDECRAMLPTRLGAWPCRVWEPDDTTPTLPSLERVSAKYPATRDKLLIHSLPPTDGHTLMLDADTATLNADVELLHQAQEWAACINPSTAAHSQLLPHFGLRPSFNSGVLIFDVEPDRSALFYEWIQTAGDGRYLREQPHGDEFWHNLAWQSGILPMPVALHPRWNWTGMMQLLQGNRRYDEVKPPIIHATAGRWRSFRGAAKRSRMAEAYEKAAIKAAQPIASRRRSCCKEPESVALHRSRKARRRAAAARPMARRNAAR